MKETKEHPLVLVFYLDRQLMKIRDIIGPFTEMINNMIEDKKLNAIAFFLPTDGEERVDCINPVIAPADEMEKIAKIIADIKRDFSVGDDNVKDDNDEVA